LREVFLGVVDDHFEGANLVVAMLFVVADAAYDALVDAGWLEADQVEDLTHVAVALSAFRVT
jgi:hypothetical protein